MNDEQNREIHLIRFLAILASITILGCFFMMSQCSIQANRTKSVLERAGHNVSYDAFTGKVEIKK